ncbi:MAG: Fic family protein [Candidatus Liptonbacteria bacterium]|nr:Fic family protein [Candidatus Liptonbacteria bacterium]
MAKKTALNARQNIILEVISKGGPINSVGVRKRLEKQITASLVTIKRDLSFLEKQGLLVQQGKGPSTRYATSAAYEFLFPTNVEQYFKRERATNEIYVRFDFDIFNLLKKVRIFSPEEVKQLDLITLDAKRKQKKISATLRAKELERFIIEFSWKSSRIEGNTYSLLETEALLTRNERAKNKNETEARMIINHKNAFARILENIERFSHITIADIETIHSLLVYKLNIPKNIRVSAVGITGTRYRPLDNQFQIREAMEKMCVLVNTLSNSYERALIAMLLIAYIQPFEDGNKRTSRLLGNAILLARGKFPISYRVTDEGEYKKAVILFYERHNASYFKTLFTEQYKFVVQNYFSHKNSVNPD